MAIRMSGREVSKILVEEGYSISRWRGDHAIHVQGSRVIHVPMHDEIRAGTLRRIFTKAKLEERYKAIINGEK